ncbi:MAG TPA: divergent PAP2 family protein [Chloroflexota bacterium]
MELFQNHVLWVSFGAWGIAQILKVLIYLLIERELDLWKFVSMGGMPSSHSALVAGLATAVGIEDGVRSSTFALAVVFASVVMYDAAGIRQAVSAQARILNRLLDEYFKHQRLDEVRLRELLGHTRFEVLIGALLGIATGLLWR